MRACVRAYMRVRERARACACVRDSGRAQEASGVVAYALCARRRIHSCRQVEQGRTRACARLFFGVSVFLCARARACLVAHDSDELLVEVKALGHLADARPDRLPRARPRETIS